MKYYKNNENMNLEIDEARLIRRREIGKTIENMRKFLEKSREELAEHLNISKSLVGLYERGERDIKSELIPEMAKFLKVEEKELKVIVNLAVTSKETVSPKDALMNKIQYICENKNEKELENAIKMLETFFDNSK